MAYTVSQIVGSDPESLLGTAGQMTNAAATVDAQIAREQSQFDTLGSDWTGTAADAAQKQGREMRTDQSAYAQRLRDAAKPLSTGGRKLADIRSQLQKAVDAAEYQWDVADDGSVRPGFWLDWYASISPVQAVQVEAKRIEAENAIKLLLAQFEAADLDTAYQLRKVGWR